MPWAQLDLFLQNDHDFLQGKRKCDGLLFFFFFLLYFS